MSHGRSMMYLVPEIYAVVYFWCDDQATGSVLRRSCKAIRDQITKPTAAAAHARRLSLRHGPDDALCMTTDPQVAAEILKYGANVNARDDLPLRGACNDGAADMVRFLLNAGADISVEDDIPLRSAARLGHEDVVRMLLKAGADPDASDSDALKWGARKGHSGVVSALIESGADVHAADNDPLCWASRKGHFDVVRMLLDAGADVDARDGSPMWWAACGGHDLILTLIIERGANTLLCGAAAAEEVVREGRHIGVMAILLDADPDIVPLDDALTVAAEGGSTAMFRYLALRAKEQMTAK
jgi:ankyrin repeat protein